jgi:MFS family permease
VFIAGLGLFTVASIAVGTAHSEAWLIAARAVQGIGAATLAPSTLALLQTSFREGPERTRAVAYYAAAAGVAATIGLVVGGIFAGWLSWRVGFFVNAPLLALALVISLAALRVPPRPSLGRDGDLDGAEPVDLGDDGVAGRDLHVARGAGEDPVAGRQAFARGVEKPADRRDRRDRVGGHR